MEQVLSAGRLRFLGPASLIYALFFTFCLYDSASGITVPFAAAGTLLYFWYIHRCTPAEGLAHGGIFLPVSIVLLGVSSCLTDSEPVIFMNLSGAALLFLVYVLRFYDPFGKWNVSRQLSAMFRAVFGAIGCIFVPFMDLAAAGENGSRKSSAARGRYVLLGILIAIPLLLVVLLLLSAADAVFGNVLNHFLSGLQVPRNLPGIILMTVFAFFASYCGIVYLQKSRSRTAADTAANSSKKGEPLPFAIASGAVLLVYILFSAVQVIFLFLHQGRLPAGMTYADYAHQGFYQLLAVCLLNLALVIACTEHLKNSRPLRGILLGICACTFIMIASAAYRMLLYIGAYDLTFLRLFVLFALAVIALWMGGVAASVVRPDFPLLRYALAVITSLYLIFSFARPDFWIARYNISAGNADTEYLCELSADSVPAFPENDPLLHQAHNLLSSHLRDTAKDFRKFNFSRAEAERILEK